MQMVNIQSLLTHELENLKEGVGDKGVRGVEGMRGVRSVRVPHTCVSTHLGIKRGLARCFRKISGNK